MDGRRRGWRSWFRTMVVLPCLAMVVTVLPVALGAPAPAKAAAAAGTDDTYVTFNGSTYFTAPDNATFDISGDLTVSVWLRPDSTCVASIECTILAKDSSFVFAIKNGLYDWALMNAAGNSWDWRGTNIRAVPNQWQHVAFVAVRSTNTMYVYFNGIYVYSVTDATSVPSVSATSSEEFTVGSRRNPTYLNKFSGQIDEVRIYNAARASQAQIQADMNTWGPANNSNLVAYYDFNEGSGTTVNNRVTGASSVTNLTGYGSPTWGSIKQRSGVNSWVVERFTRSYLVAAGGWEVPTGVSAVNLLVVGGGGGGNTDAGGGGGGGGMRSDTGVSVSAGTLMQVAVGGGGLGGAWAISLPLVGGESRLSWSGKSYVGGGGGVGQGWLGSTNGTPSGGSGGTSSGDGTGSNGAAGGNGPQSICSNTLSRGTVGGTGPSSTISGTATRYGGGGGGGTQVSSETSSSSTISGQSGGAGGGGRGADWNLTDKKATNGTAGSENTGGGGGGGHACGDTARNSRTYGNRTDGGFGGTGLILVTYVAPCDITEWTQNDGSKLIQYILPSVTDLTSCSSTYTTPAGLTALDAFVVGGGGGGGGGNSTNNTGGGGGGGGQALNLRAQTVTASTSYTIVVGRGGAGGAGAAGAGTAGGAGTSSSAFGSTASGGAGGGAAPTSGDINSAAGDGGASGSGNSGGGNVWEGGGGGAGAGSPGGAGADISGTGGTGGVGGNGVLPGWLIGWCSGMFGGGGAGGTTGGSTYAASAGGAGGGGNGGSFSSAASSGTNHCGGGGGGGGGQTGTRNGGNGGSGIVFVRAGHAYSAESFSEGSDLEVAVGAATNLGFGASTIADYGNGETVRARVATTNGTLSVVSASGSTVTGGGTASVTIVGSQSQVNSALDSMTLTVSTVASTQVTLDVDMNPTNQTIGSYTYTYHTNGHFYLYRAISGATIGTAASTAVGMWLGNRQGFLATPTSSAELSVMNTVRGSSPAWIGVTDDFQENTFRLIGEDAWGPISTGSSAISGRFVSWPSGQPDNAAGLEDYVDLSGSFNDLPATHAGSGALIEFEPKSSRRIHNVRFTAAASRDATVSRASNLGLGSSHIGASTFTTNETIVATLTSPAGTTLAATGAATITGSGSTSMTIEGTKVNVNATLANVMLTSASTGDRTVTVSYRAKEANNGTSSAYKYNSTTGNYYLELSARSWTSAQSDAAAARFGGVPGSLVSSTNATEQSWLRSTFGTSAFWTALNDTANEGQWSLQTRDAYQTYGFDNVALPGGYLPWNTNEPNGGTGQNCHTSQWDTIAGDDGTCTSNLRSVVEFRPYAVSQDVTIAVVDGPTITTPSTGLLATVGAAYSLTLSAADGVTPYSYSVASGTLPDGLSLSSSGVISGTATDSPQSRAVTVTVTDANGATATTSSFTLTTNATTCVTTSTVVGLQTVHQFTSTGYCQWEVPVGVTTVDAFVVGGGGGGGADGAGGGGGGGYHPVNGIAVTPGDVLTVRVGAGGVGGTYGSPSNAGTGGTSSIAVGSTVVVSASGGGAAANGPSSTPGAGGTSANGFAGGAGGAASTVFPSQGGVGKTGAVNYFLGSATQYGGGGGGGNYDTGAQTYSAKAGASGGGNGCDSTGASNTQGAAGTANTGGGGGGGCAGIVTNGGAGGSGVAMIRFATDSLDAFPADISGLQGRYVADEYQTLDSSRKAWIDSSNSARSVTTIGGAPSVMTVTGNGSGTTVRTVNGGVSENLTWPSLGIVSSTYTMFHLARYSGSTKHRIFTSNSGNWLSGFWSGASGVAFHNNWLTNSSPSNASTSGWVLSSDQNLRYRANGKTIATAASGQSLTGNFTINTGFHDGERSDWQVPEVIVYNRVLSLAEIRRVESYLARTYDLLGYDSANTSQGVLDVRSLSAAKIGTVSTGSSTQLSVSWTAPTDTTDVTGYSVEYRESGASSWTTWGSTASTSATLTGLVSATTYEIRVTPVDSGAANRPSVTATQTTWGATSVSLSGVPASPETLTSYTLTATVTGATGTSGTVNFFENGTAITGCTSRTVTSGEATCSWTPGTLGSRSLTATFSGDASYLESSTVSASSATVARGTCTTTNGTTGRFTYWKVLDVAECELPALPAGVESIDVLVVGGGGGGGENVGSGGGGGGAYYATNVSATSADEIVVVVGAGGRSGGTSLGNEIATTDRDGGAGSPSSVAWGATTFTGAGGAAGETYHLNNACVGSGGQVTTRPAGGVGTGTGGSSSTGGLGGIGSSSYRATPQVGAGGYSHSITGSPVTFGGGGGGGGWGIAGAAGGSGGGGAGSIDSVIATNGTANTGGGGGGGGAGCTDGGTGGSGIVIVRYANVPTISTAPTAATKVSGQSHTFSVTPAATGAVSGDFTYQWKKNGVAISGATSSSYTIATLSTADAGSYSVEVKSDSGSGAVSSVESTAVTLTVDKDTQSITFTTPTARTYGDGQFAMMVTASSGLQVSFTTSDATVCTTGSVSLSSGITTVIVSIGDAGSCDITAAQAGNSEYEAATSVTRTLTVNKKTLTLSGLSATDKEYNRSVAATVDYSGYSFGSSVVSGDVVTLSSGSASASFADWNVGTNKTVTVTGFSLGGTDATNYELPSPITTTADITAKNLTVAGVTTTTREYDATRTASVGFGSATVTGVVSGDDVSLDTTGVSAEFNDKTVGVGKVVTITGVVLDGADKANYTVTQPSSTGTVTAKNLTVSGVSTTTREYDATRTASVGFGSATVTGVVSGDDVSLDTTGVSAEFNDKTVSVGKAVTITGVVLDGADKANYTITQPSSTGTVTAKQLTATGITGVDKEYDRGTDADLDDSAAGLSGVISGDAVTLDSGSATGAFADKTVGVSKTVTVSGLALDGADKDNYTLAGYTTTATITVKNLTVSGVSTTTREYDATRAATVSFGSATINGVVSGDDISLDTTGVSALFDDKTVGVGKSVSITGVVLDGVDKANYTVTQPSSTGTVTAKQLTATGITGVDKEYDRGTDADLDDSAAGLSGVISGDAVTLDSGSATGAFADKTVGVSKTVTVSGLALDGADNGNYTLAAYTTTATITAKNLTVSGITASDKDYDKSRTAVVQHGNAQLVGVISGDTVTIDTTNIAGLFDTVTVGSGKIVRISGVVLDGADKDNYTVTQPTTTASIATKTITVSGVTADNKEYNGTDTATLWFNQATISGVEANDVVSLDTSLVTATFSDETAGMNKTVSVAGLALAGDDASNYRLVQPTAYADITKKQLTATGITGVDREYDASLVAGLNVAGAGLSGVIGSDDVSIVTSGATGAFATKTVGVSKTVTVSGLALDGADKGNYTLAGYITTATITAKNLTVSGVTTSTREYDATRTAAVGFGSATVTGVVSGDDVSLDTTGVSALFNDKTAGVGKAVSITGVVLDGADKSNYTVTQPSSTGTVTAKQLTATGITAADKEYDRLLGASLVVNGAGLSGVIGSDDVSIVTSGATGAFATKTVGINKTLTVSGLALDGADKDNYTLAGYTTTADITAKNLTVAGVTTTTREYDATRTASVGFGSATVTGVVSGDDVSLDTTGVSALFADKTVGVGKQVTVSGLALSGGDKDNYTVTQPTSTGTVTAKNLTVSGVTTTTREYDATRTATVGFGSATITGVVSGDDVSLNTSVVAALFADKTVGVGKQVTITGVVLAGADAPNYTVTQPSSTGTVTAKDLTVIGVTSTDRNYNGSRAAVIDTSSASFSGVMGNDTVVLDATAAQGTYIDELIGDDKTVTVTGIVATGTDGANYRVPSFTVTSSILGRLLTVTGVTAGSREYDGFLSATSILNFSQAQLSGVVQGDGVALNTSGAVGAFTTRTAGTNKTITVTGVTISGPQAANYSLRPIQVTGAITTKNLTIAGVTASAHTYDGGVDASSLVDMSSASLQGVISPDTVSIDSSAMQAQFADAAVGAAKPVTITGVSLSGIDASNYTVSQPSTTADIEHRPVTVTGVTIASRTYDGTVAATSLVNTTAAALANTVQGDDVRVVSTSVSAVFAQRAAGTNKPVTMAGFALAGADSSNYRIIQPTGTATVTPKTVTVTGVAARDKLFDGTTAAEISTANAAMTGLIGNDVATLDASQATGAFDDEKVGTAKTVRITGLRLTGTDAGNYSIGPVTATASIDNATTAWMEFKAQTATATETAANPVQPAAVQTMQLPPAPARVTTRSVSRGASTRVTAVRAPKDAAIPVNRAIITVASTKGKVLARINVRVDPTNPTTTVTVPYSSKRVRVTVQFANELGVSAGGRPGINIAEGNTFAWGTVNGVPQVKGTSVPGSLVFARGSSTLTTSMKTTLKKMARTAKARGGLVYVTGYAQKGELRSAWLLDSLARKRAEVVAKYLSTVGVRQWITFQGHAGLSSPWNTTRERRVAVSTDPFTG